MRLCKFNNENSINIDGAVLYGTALFLSRIIKEQKQNLDEEIWVELLVPENGEHKEVRYRLYTARIHPNDRPVTFQQSMEKRKKHVVITMNIKSLLVILDFVLHNQLYLSDETTGGETTVVQLNINENNVLEVQQRLCSVNKYTEKKEAALKMARLFSEEQNKTTMLIPYKVFFDYMKELSDKFAELKASGFDLQLFVFDLIFTDSFNPSKKHFKFSINTKNPQSIMSFKKEWTDDTQTKLASYTISMTINDFEEYIMPSFHKISQDIRSHRFLQKDTLMMVVNESEDGLVEIESFYKENYDCWNEGVS